MKKLLSFSEESFVKYTWRLFNFTWNNQAETKISTFGSLELLLLIKREA